MQKVYNRLLDDLKQLDGWDDFSKEMIGMDNDFGIDSLAGKLERSQLPEEMKLDIVDISALNFNQERMRMDITHQTEDFDLKDILKINNCEFSSHKFTPTRKDMNKNIKVELVLTDLVDQILSYLSQRTITNSSVSTKAKKCLEYLFVELQKFNDCGLLKFAEDVKNTDKKLLQDFRYSILIHPTTKFERLDNYQGVNSFKNPQIPAKKYKKQELALTSMSKRKSLLKCSIKSFNIIRNSIHYEEANNINLNDIKYGKASNRQKKHISTHKGSMVLTDNKKRIYPIIYKLKFPEIQQSGVTNDNEIELKEECRKLQNSKMLPLLTETCINTYGETVKSEIFTDRIGKAEETFQSNIKKHLMIDMKAEKVQKEVEIMQTYNQQLETDIVKLDNCITSSSKELAFQVNRNHDMLLKIKGLRKSLLKVESLNSSAHRLGKNFAALIGEVENYTSAVDELLSQDDGSFDTDKSLRKILEMITNIRLELTLSKTDVDDTIIVIERLKKTQDTILKSLNAMKTKVSKLENLKLSLQDLIILENTNVYPDHDDKIYSINAFKDYEPNNHTNNITGSKCSTVKKIDAYSRKRAFSYIVESSPGNNMGNSERFNKEKSEIKHGKSNISKQATDGSTSLDGNQHKTNILSQNKANLEMNTRALNRGSSLISDK